MFPESLQVADKVGEMGIHRQLMYVLVLAGPKVNESSILTQFYNLFIFRVMNTGIDIHQKPLLPQFVSKLSDINTHAAGIFRPQIPHGTTMNTYHS